MTIERIRVPVDPSEHPGAALKRAIELAKASDAAIDLGYRDQIDSGAMTAYAVVTPENLREELCVAAPEQLETGHRPPTRTRG